MKNQIQWNKSDGGYVYSKCGKFRIEPIFCGRTTPIGYNAFFVNENKALKLSTYTGAQRQAKEDCEKYLKSFKFFQF